MSDTAQQLVDAITAPLIKRIEALEQALAASPALPWVNAERRTRRHRESSWKGIIMSESNEELDRIAERMELARYMDRDKIVNALDELKRLRRERDDLLAACEAAAHVWEQGHVDRGWKDDVNWVDKVKDQIDAAIAKATGKETT